MYQLETLLAQSESLSRLFDSSAGPRNQITVIGSQISQIGSKIDTLPPKPRAIVIFAVNVIFLSP